MNKKLLAGIAIAIACAGNANAQTQVANSGFEEWESVTYKQGLKKLNGDEPVNWSSFVDATGGMKSIGAAVQLFKETENVHGGTACAKLTTNSVLGIVAQGNLTTGCVNMGSATATDATGNYNYVNEANPGQAMRFTGRPKKFTVWLRGKCSMNANVAIHLVTKGYYQDPFVEGRNTAKLIAMSQITPALASETEWTQYEGEFTYYDSADPYYVLVNVSTSAVPGEGNAQDVLYVDDLEMVYDMDNIDRPISDVNAPSQTYNIMGQRTSNAHGIIIKNGKKFIVK